MFRSTIILAAALSAAAALAPVPAGAAGPKTPGIMNPEKDRPGLSLGDTAPDATLKKIDGSEVSLASLYADGPVIVTFYRGGWCPFCTKALAGWEKRMGEVEAMDATFVAITPESPENAGKTTSTHAPSMMILSDTGHAAARAFRLSFELPDDLQEKYKGYGIDLEKSNSSGRWELPAPGTYVIDRTGKIVYAWADWDYKQRADPDEVLKAVKAAGER